MTGKVARSHRTEMAVIGQKSPNPAAHTVYTWQITIITVLWLLARWPGIAKLILLYFTSNV